MHGMLRVLLLYSPDAQLDYLAALRPEQPSSSTGAAAVAAAAAADWDTRVSEVAWAAAYMRTVCSGYVGGAELSWMYDCDIKGLTITGILE